MTYNEYEGTTDELIKTYIPYAFRIARSLQYLAPHNLAGLEGEALLALCESIQVVKRKPDIPMLGIIITVIRRYLYEYAAKDVPVRVPRKTYALNKEKKFTRKSVASLISHPANISEWHTTCMINEIIDDMQLTAKQRDLLKLMFDDYTRAELAEIYHVSTARMTQLKFEIKKKLLNYLRKNDVEYK